MFQIFRYWCKPHPSTFHITVGMPTAAPALCLLFRLKRISSTIDYYYYSLKLDA